MRIATLFLTLPKQYFGLKHLLTCFSVVLDLLVVVEVLSSGLRHLPSLSVIIGLSFSGLITSTEQNIHSIEVHFNTVV
jgi:hypothetical protein